MDSLTLAEIGMSGKRVGETLYCFAKLIGFNTAYDDYRNVKNVSD